MPTQQTGPLWLTDPEAYRRKMRDLLGGRDPIAVLAEGPGTFTHIVGRHTPQQMRARPYPGKWTPNEILGHLTDVEWVYGFRIRLILCQDRPAITGYDQELWVAGQKLNDRDPNELLEMFRALRGYNLVLWRHMTPQDLKRAGEHAERGRETLQTMLEMHAGHDLWHADQLTRYLKAVKG